MYAEGGTMNAWKLSTIILASMLAGFLLAQVAGFGFVSAQSGGIVKLQLDTSNCISSTSRPPLPTGAFVVQVVPQERNGDAYVYNVCR